MQEIVTRLMRAAQGPGIPNLTLELHGMTFTLHMPYLTSDSLTWAMEGFIDDIVCLCDMAEAAHAAKRAR